MAVGLWNFRGAFKFVPQNGEKSRDFLRIGVERCRFLCCVSEIDQNRVQRTTFGVKLVKLTKTVCSAPLLTFFSKIDQNRVQRTTFDKL